IRCSRRSKKLIKSDAEAWHVAKAFLNGRGLPSEIVDYEVDRYKQKLFIMACQMIEHSQEEGEK
ncbi:hypothetical protein, partial [Brevibacillus laterosporus]